MIKRLIFLFFLIIFLINYQKAKSQDQVDDSNLYFSFKKNREELLIGLEGYILINGKKYSSEELSYEWKVDLGDNYEKIKTYKPFLFIPEINNKLSGIVTLSPKNFNYEIEKHFYFTNKQLPRVVIAKYDKNNNLALPLTENNLNKTEVLYPLVYNFSSNNLAYVWTVNETNYYNTFLLDISSLTGEIKINLRVYNLDNSQELASDQIMIKK
ncbi:MAG: hypothetical protein KatS3mg094_322 [Candidatus Parcubacteria bacterium]|nr:MAG: hypothetical protein KatS3mg094_322 [Candidatus Parcubacteria bacterium]